MSSAASAQAVASAIDAVMRADQGRLLAALSYRLRDIALAEDVLQEACISALIHWGRAGLPASPQGWLLRVALRRAIDRMRAAGRAARGQAEIALLAEEEAQETGSAPIADARLRMIFTCCHPALDAKSRVALTLRVICGLSTAQIAAVFLDTEATMGQRLSRAKAKIAAAGIGFAIPGPEAWPQRLQSVLTVVYLIFTSGYRAGPHQGRDLCEEALFLARLLMGLSQGEPEIEGTLALMLITHARAGARGQGATLAAQDRNLWDAALLAEGVPLVAQALGRGRVGPFQIKAAIAACHVAKGGPDWPQIAALYEVLLRFEDTPIVRLSRAVALAEVGGAEAGAARGLDEILALGDALSDYGPYHAALAEALARMGRTAAAEAAFLRAIALAETLQDADFWAKRRAALRIP